MKYLSKIIFLASVVITFFAACNKVSELPYYPPTPATALVLSSSVTTTTPVPADSMKNIIIFSWTNPRYANDSTTTKYILEIDSAGRNFSKEQTIVLTGKTSDTLTAKSLNTVLLNLGFAYNTAYNVDVRVTSSYANNNEQLKSNTVTVKMTPYVVPPKVVPPVSKTLFIVGAATVGGWGNPVPAPAQKFTRLDSVTYQGTFFLNGGQQYLLLPVNGDWSSKFAVQDNTISGLSAGGDFGFNVGSAFNANFPGPAATGMYKITVDFQHGKFTVAAVGSYGLLYVPGDYQGWTPATAPTLGSPKNDGVYEGYINFPAGGTFEFKVNKTPDWSNSFGDGGSGMLSASGGNLKVPGAGYYKINANTTANTWSASKTTWGLIGSFAPSGWGSDVNMSFDAGSNSWSGTITLTATDEFKFRANGAWDLNYGDTGADGSLDAGGDNIKGFAAGTYKVTLFLNNSNYYTYKLEKQ